MTLVVEDGSGRSDAESPQSIAEIDAYHEREGNADWSGTEAEKETWARRATLRQEQLYAGRFSGYRRVYNQALSYPRCSSFTAAGALIGVDEVPAWWKAIHAELALRAKRGEVLPDMERGGQLQSYSVGPSGPDRLTISKSFAAGAPAGKSFAAIEAIADLYLRPANELRSWA